MKVVFDTDPGIDDAMALLYLDACSNLELLGITTTPGNASIEQCTNNALILCELFDISVPIHAGIAETINGIVLTNYPDFVHGTNGLGDITLPATSRQPADTGAVDYLIKSAQEFSSELTLIAVGRLTNLALAIRSDDKFAKNLKQIIFMGGAFKHEGNVTPWAEANIMCDPEAASIVFESGIPLTMVGLDVTMKTRMSHAYLTELTGYLGDIGSMVKDMNEVYASYYKKEQGLDEFPVHDSSAIAFAHRPEYFAIETGTLSCVLEGDQRGRTTFRPDPQGRHCVCVGVDADALLSDYLDTVKRKYD
jgi:purine nucleosidase